MRLRRALPEWFSTIFRLASVLRVLPGFREIGVGGLEHRVLIPVPKLSLHGSIASLTFLFLF